MRHLRELDREFKKFSFFDNLTRKILTRVFKNEKRERLYVL